MKITHQKEVRIRHREELRVLLDKPVIVSGDRTDKKKSASNLLLVKHPIFIHPRIGIVRGQVCVELQSIKIHHSWIPADCAIGEIWHGYVHSYTKTDGTTSFGLRSHVGEGELKQLEARLIMLEAIKLITIVKKIGNRHPGIENSINRIIALASNFFGTGDTSKWGHLSRESVDKETQASLINLLDTMLRLKWAIESKRTRGKNKRDAIATKKKGFASSPIV